MMDKTLIGRVRGSYKLGQVRAWSGKAFWSGLAPLRRPALPWLLARRAEVNIHFGCGPIHDPRFINVDARAMRHVHVVTRSPLLRAFPLGCADMIYACHVFEHLPFARQKAVLTRWLDILKPGGRVMISVPDFDKLVDRYLANERNPRSIQEPLMGGQDYPGNFHFAIFTRSHLMALLDAAGFTEIAEWHPRDEVSWPQDYSWADWISLNVCARRPR